MFYVLTPKFTVLVRSVVDLDLSTRRREKTARDAASLRSCVWRRRIELDMAAARAAYIDRRIELFEKFSKE